MQQQAQQKQTGQGGGKRKRKRGGGKNPATQSPNDLLGLEPGAEGVVAILDLDTLKIRKKLYVTRAPVDLAFNASGTVLAALMAGGKGEMWDTAAWDEQGGKLSRTGGTPGFVPQQPGGKPDAPGSIEPGLLVLSPDADWAAARQNPSTRSPAGVWDTRTGQVRPIDQSAVSQLGFLPDGTLVCAARQDVAIFRTAGDQARLPAVCQTIGLCCDKRIARAVVEELVRRKGLSAGSYWRDSADKRCLGCERKITSALNPSPSRERVG